MEYNQKIHIYVVTGDFNAPVACSPDNHIEMKSGDVLVTIGETVFIENKPNPNNDPLNFTEALFKKNFLDINPTIFKKQL